MVWLKSSTFFVSINTSVVIYVSAALCSMLTFDPVTKGHAWVNGTESITQHLLLELDDWLEHRLVLDLSGRDHNAAVHEVCDGVGHIFFSLGQEGLQTEHLSEQKHRDH